MSLRFQQLNPVPGETSRIVKRVFPKGHLYIAFADGLGDFLDCWDFTELYPFLGQSAVHPAKMALAMILQEAEGLSDKQVSEQIAANLLWKYVLRLDLDDEGWDESGFSEFRTRLIEAGAQNLIFDKLLDAARENGLLRHSKQRTDATHQHSVARYLSRIELVFEAVRNCLEELLEVAPQFVHAIKKPEWMERYFLMRPFNYKLPKKDDARRKLAETVGQDGYYLIEKIADEEELQGLKSVYLLCRILDEQFSDGDKGLRFRSTEELKPTGECIVSIHDTDATIGSKRGSTWLGYKVHLTETIDEGAPHLITNVLTTKAHVNDSLVLPAIHQSLKQRGLKMDEHWVDSGYPQVDELTKASDRDGIDVLTRLTSGHCWQLQEGKGFDISCFRVDWETRKVSCPQGIKSDKWKPQNGKNREINVSFPVEECKKCPVREDCTRSESRKLHLKSKPVYEYMEFQRLRQETKEFIEKYKKRAGIEGTISQAVNRTNQRRSRFVGLAKTHLGNLLASTALNFVRIGNWLMKIPLANTRTSRYEMAFGVCA